MMFKEAAYLNSVELINCISCPEINTTAIFTFGILIGIFIGAILPLRLAVKYYMRRRDRRRIEIYSIPQM